MKRKINAFGMPDSSTQPDSRVPSKSYMIAHLGNVHVETPAIKFANELYDFVQYVATMKLRPDGDEGFIVREEAKELLAKITKTSENKT